MFKYKDDTLKLLGKNSNPTSKLRNSTANPFTTNIKKNRTYFGIEVILSNPISLIEELFLPVVKVVDNLREYMLLLSNLMPFQISLPKLPIILRIIFPLCNKDKDEQNS